MLEFILDVYFECNFFVYLLIAVCLLYFPAPRRKLFALRMAAGALLGIALTYLYSLLPQWITLSELLFNIYYCIKYFFCFALACGCAWICFALPLSKTVFYGICGYAVQHLGYSLFLILHTVLELNGLGFAQQSPAFTAIELGVMAVVYLFVFFFYGKYARRITEDVRGHKLILPFSLMLGAAAILSVFCVNATGTTRILFSIYASLLCATMLYAMYMVYEAAQLLYEKKTLRAVAAKQKEQYEMSKNNIDYINVKCHDLRKQIDLLRGGKVSDEKLRELRESISIYDSVARTGNETLDVILSEKGLFCEREGIRFTCMADGESLAFLDAVDLCAIFCNLLDNAIEAVMKIPDRERRMISLKVAPLGNLVHIVAYNNYEEAAVLENGAFRTTKSDRRDHGFGIKSVRMAVESYRGEMKIYTQGGVFSVNILLPRPEKTA